MELQHGLEIVEASFSNTKAIQRAAAGSEAYFLISPPDERQAEWQRTQVTAAVKAGTARVVKLSAYDTGPDSDWNMGRRHWDGELALRESGLPHAILRPQYFFQNLLRPQALRAGTMRTYIPADRPVGAVDADDIADCATVLLTTAELTPPTATPTRSASRWSTRSSPSTSPTTRTRGSPTRSPHCTDVVMKRTRPWPNSCPT